MPTFLWKCSQKIGMLVNFGYVFDHITFILLLNGISIAMRRRLFWQSNF